MRTYGIDGVWLQRFAVDLPGGPCADRYSSDSTVLRSVRNAAAKTGRVWAIQYDLSGAPPEKAYDLLVADWQKLIADGLAKDPRYLLQGGMPVVQIWGLFPGESGRISAETAERLVDFFQTPGPTAAFVIGGGVWNWRQTKDPRWRAVFRRFKGFAPWNVGNASVDSDGVRRATTNYWADERKECACCGMLWLPVIYPGFSWDNLTQKPAGTTGIPRRKGDFLWEQFHTLSAIGADSIDIAMFDEVDEGTAIFKVSNDPPVQSHFVTYEGLPSDWYLRLVGEGARLFQSNLPCPAKIPLSP